MSDKEKQPKKKKRTVTDNFDRSLEDIRLKETFIRYARWRALPVMLLSFKRKGKILNDQETCDVFGIDDDETMFLMQFKSQKDFAKHFNVSEDALTDWNKKLASRDLLADSRVWAKRLIKNVVMKLYEGAVSKGGMSFKDREMFFKVIGNWNEKQSLELDVGPTLFEILKKGNHDRRPRK